MPYWPKLHNYAAFHNSFHSYDSRLYYTEEQPWALFELPEIQVAVAAMNSDMAESHQDGDHYGWLGEKQLIWFAARLQEYRDRNWLRIAAVDHNVLRGATSDDENLRDVDTLKRRLFPHINIVFHGHTHVGGRLTLLDGVPILSTGSAGVAFHIWVKFPSLLTLEHKGLLSDIERRESLSDATLARLTGLLAEVGVDSSQVDDSDFFGPDAAATSHDTLDTMLSSNPKLIYLLIDDTEQVASSSTPGHLNRVWGFLLAVRRLAVASTVEQVREHISTLCTVFSIEIGGLTLRPDSQRDTLRLWHLLYESGVLNARIADSRQPAGFRHVDPFDDPTLVSQERWNDMQALIWEIYPAYRDFLLQVGATEGARDGLAPWSKVKPDKDSGRSPGR